MARNLRPSHEFAPRYASYPVTNQVWASGAASARIADFVNAGRLMQVATLNDVGRPQLCHVWYDFMEFPDRLVFVSRPARQHCGNLRRRPTVAGGIVVDVPAGLGDPVQGVSFSGQGQELGPGASPERESFLARWPRSASALASIDPAVQSYVYRILVTEWVLFDEVNFPDQPRQVVVPN